MSAVRQLCCDATDCPAVLRGQGRRWGVLPVTFSLLRRRGRRLGWVRLQGDDFCGVHAPYAQEVRP